MELGHIIPLSQPIFIQPSPPPRTVVVKDFTNSTLTNFIKSTIDTYGDANQILKDSKAKSKPNSAPWADVKDAIGSVVLHTDPDSKAQIKEQSQVVDLIRNKAIYNASRGGDSTPFSFSWLDNQLNDQTNDSTKYSAPGCPNGAAE